VALASTTLSTAVAATDKSIVVASATSVAAGRYVRIGEENMQVAQNYTSGTTVPVLRGREGSRAMAHASGSTVLHGLASDFVTPAPQSVVTYPAMRPWTVQEYTGATNTFVLPASASNVHVLLNGTTADTITFPVPTKDLTGMWLLVSSNGVAQHVLTFTGGINGAGSGYTTITVNASAPGSFLFVAIDGLWHAMCTVPISGTTTKAAGVIA